MRTSTLFALLLSLSFAPALRAEETWSGTSQVTFKGASTLHDFEGSLPPVPLKVRVAQGKDGRVVSATSRAEVKQMNTRNEKRDQDMRRMFNEAVHHFIAVEVTDAREAALHPPGGAPGSMPITLTIAGQSGKVTGTVTKVVEQPAAVSFDLAFPVSLKSFHLEPPSTMGGLVKVKDTVNVTAHVVLKKESR